MKTPEYRTFVVAGGGRGCGKTLADLVNAYKRIHQPESTYSQVSKALCGKENATPDELLQAVDQLKSLPLRLEYALLLMISQYCQEGGDTVSHLWMEAGETAFELLGIENHTPNAKIEELIDQMEYEHKPIFEMKLAFQKQAPRAVEHGATLYRCGTCPSCGNVVSQHEKWGETTVRIEAKYCKFCGQHLDWRGFSETPLMQKRIDQEETEGGI